GRGFSRRQKRKRPNGGLSPFGLRLFIVQAAAQSRYRQHYARRSICRFTLLFGSTRSPMEDCATRLATARCCTRLASGLPDWRRWLAAAKAMREEEAASV